MPAPCESCKTTCGSGTAACGPNCTCGQNCACGDGKPSGDDSGGRKTFKCGRNCECTDFSSKKRQTSDTGFSCPKMDAKGPNSFSSHVILFSVLMSILATLSALEIIFFK